MATWTLAQRPTVIHALAALQRCGWSEEQAKRLVFVRLFAAREDGHPQWPAIYRPFNLKF